MYRFFPELWCISIVLLVSSATAGAQTTQWVTVMPGPPLSPTLYPDTHRPSGVIVAAGAALIRLNADGEMVWEVALEKPVAHPPAAADLNDDGSAEIVFVLQDGTVVCLDGDGNTRWARRVDAPSDGMGMISVGDVHPAEGLEILVAVMDGWLYCFGADGDLIWRFHGDRFRVGPPTIGDVDGDGFAEVLYGTDNGNIYCLTGFGDVRWRYSELAPYGRSGITLADLRDDGRVSALITRSNTGNATCLMALDAATGAFQWRKPDVMQSYVAIATADLDGDGVLEILHGDKGNWLYCTNADGAERWRTELAGRGIFFAPAIADCTGDGVPEILVGMRDTDPHVGACAFVVGADGRIIAPVKLGASGNAAPVVADLNGDGTLTALFATQHPNAIHALTWGAGGQVAWPILRGDSSLTGRGNAPRGMPGAETSAPVAPLRLKHAAAFLGENRLAAAWDAPAPAYAFAQIAVRPMTGPAEIRINPLEPGATSATLRWENIAVGEFEVVVRIMASGLDAPLAEGAFRGASLPPDTCDMDALAAACDAAMRVGMQHGQDVSGLELGLVTLEAAQRALRREAATIHGLAVFRLAQKATALRKQAGELNTFARALQSFWEMGHGGSFVCGQDCNPWDHFDPLAMPVVIEPNPVIHIKVFGDEFESVAINILNITARPLDVRCAFSRPLLEGGKPPRDPELARRITLRRGVLVPSHKSGMVMDALPELDDSRAIRLCPGETAQLWLTVDTYGLEAGVHELPLFLGSLEAPATIREVTLRIEVWPVRLPQGVYAQMNWVGVDPDETSDQQLQDMIDHGISVTYGPRLPVIPLDADGNLAAPVDWRATDAGLERVPDYFQFLFPAPPALRWPEGIAPEEDSDLHRRGFATALREMARHLEEKGFGYDRWAFYPYDEPWLTGFTMIPALRAFCERVRAADPDARIYTDPAGLVRVQYVAEFKDLIDIWQPEMNILKRDPELVRWFQANAAVFWAYEATDPAKDLLPLGYYRAFAWLAMHFGLDGAGFWCYKYHDAWWPLETTDWSVVYQTDNRVVPSRRWEACRDGQEDFRAMHALRRAAENARTAGFDADADRAEALLDEALESVIGRQLREIDEITRQTRDYEVDFDAMMAYRERFAREIIRLKALLEK